MMKPPSDVIIGSGRNFKVLADAISDAVHAALSRGMEVDEACCCAAAVIADYARAEYGNEYLDSLAYAMKERAAHALPSQVEAQAPDGGNGRRD